MTMSQKFPSKLIKIETVSGFIESQAFNFKTVSVNKMALMKCSCKEFNGTSIVNVIINITELEIKNLGG